MIKKIKLVEGKPMESGETMNVVLVKKYISAIIKTDTFTYWFFLRNVISELIFEFDIAMILEDFLQLHPAGPLIPSLLTGLLDLEVFFLILRCF